MVTEVLHRMELPRTTETERRVEEALEEVAERAVEEIRENSFVAVDPGPLLGGQQKWILPVHPFPNSKRVLGRTLVWIPY